MRTFAVLDTNIVACHFSRWPACHLRKVVVGGGVHSVHEAGAQVQLLPASCGVRGAAVGLRRKVQVLGLALGVAPGARLLQTARV